MTRRDRTERDAVLLGHAGLLPFAGGAMVLWLSPSLFPVPLAEAVLGWTLVYAAIILSFMGGARWGLAMLHPSARPGRAFSGLLAAVAPALVAWAMLVPMSLVPLPTTIRLSVLAATFVALLADDIVGVKTGEGPSWYGRLRTRLTFWVVVALTLIVLRLLVA